MSAATSTILTIAAIGASGAVGVYGAKKASDAAKTASEQQAAGAQQALALQKQMYEQTRTDLQPYREQGGQGLTALSSFLGMPATGGATGAPATTGSTSAPLLPGGIGPTSARGPALGTPVGTAVPRGTAAMGQSAYGPPTGAPMAGGNMVMLRAPTGETRAVPADHVAHYLALGATQV